ncbi:diguanylate cyclase domain-containing protein [Halomonas lysinitropha]|uniref:Putative diguanylate cyclase YcdT n=1 Tax=Halomonas lysinitropha TaxID=2607506 RepID=A0A5K1I4H4_9GAMM|nr:diguanylate cyclase [Halomonas lysinitropha]VVZ95007.1 putative diguanylate cyclase YcdT [Halomonas lysinitropha]
MSADQWAEGVDRLLAEIGPVTGASRVWIFQLLEVQSDAVVQDYVFEWASSERYRQLNQNRFRFFSAAVEDPVYRRLVEERQAGLSHDFCIPVMPEGPFRRDLAGQSIQSMATVPIFVNGHWWGTLGIDDCERPVSWRGPGLDLLEAAGQLIAAALYRYQLNHRSRQIELFHKVANCGVWEISLRNGRVWCSQALKTVLGYPETYPRVPLRRLLARLHSEDRAALRACLRDLWRAAESAQFRLDARLRLADRSWLWHEIIGEIQCNESGRPVAIAGLVLDISRRKQDEEQALAASQLDALTGALNRRGMDEHLETIGPVTGLRHLILLDIDHFKEINDTHGHLVGDALLRMMVGRLRHELRPDDGLVRLGGEEFAVLVGGLGDDQAMALAERLRRRIAAEPFLVEMSQDEPPLKVAMSISLGVARQGDDVSQAPNQLMAEADQALYAAKHGGRNCALFYGEAAERRAVNLDTD